jgi:hypothetical protein
MFHVCIENVSKKFFFTEKLIDCFLCKSIPIYLGCPNINEYFDTSGMILVNDLNSLINACNSVDDKFYYDSSDVIEKNYLQALKWINYPERLNNKIKELIKNEA